MPDMSLTDMLYFLLGYSKDGMTLSEIQAELSTRFGWEGSESSIENKLNSESGFCCTGGRWKVQ